MQERYRTCNKIEPTYTDCDGENVQQAGCTADACPGKMFTSFVNLHVLIVSKNMTRSIRKAGKSMSPE